MIPPPETPKEQTYPIEDNRSSSDGQSGKEGETKTTCPECGAEMSSGGACLRCGFAKGTTRPQQEKPPAAPNTKTTPLVAPGRCDMWLPATVGGLAILVLIIAHAAGWPGLYAPVPPEQTIDPGLGGRLTELLRNLVLVVFWSGCGVAGLFAMSMIEERQFGDARLATVRMAAIMATVRLATLLVVPGPEWVELTVEALLQAGGFVILAMFLFMLTLRDAVVLTVSTLMAILLLWLFTFAVQWALAV